MPVVPERIILPYKRYYKYIRLVPFVFPWANFFVDFRSQLKIRKLIVRFFFCQGCLIKLMQQRLDLVIASLALLGLSAT